MPFVNRRAFFGACAAGATLVTPASTHASALAQVTCSGGAPEPSPAQQLQILLDGAAVTQMVYVVARARVADHLGVESPTIDEIAGATGLHADSLYRVNMLVRTGGRNRTREEYQALLARGGFRMNRAIQAIGDLHLLEAAAS